MPRPPPRPEDVPSWRACAILSHSEACTDFILVNGNDIKDSAPVLAIPGIQATGETKQAGDALINSASGRYQSRPCEKE